MRHLNKILGFTLLLAARPGCAVEFEVMDKLVANGAATLKSSATIIVPDTQSASLWASTSTVTPHLFVSTTGNVGVGTSTPSTRLEVAGQVKITGGGPGAGKVLTSDAAGLAAWGTVSAPTGDNLGNHVATTTLNMYNFDITSVSTITVSSITTVAAGVTFSTNVFVTGSLGAGTSSPAAVLHAQSSPASAYALIVSTGSAPSQQILSISSSGVTNIRNLVIENRTGDPPAPTVGQAWIRTD